MAARCISYGDRIDDNIEDYIVVTDDDVIMLTAPTEMLQTFYLENTDSPGFFDLDDEPLKRIDDVELEHSSQTRPKVMPLENPQ